MQLFLTDFNTKGDNITIKDSEILNQIRKVLRMKIGDHIFVQHENMRFDVQIQDWNTDTIHGKIINTIKCPGQKDSKGIAIAMPNKWEKMELIVQKLTEIGIKNIYFWPSERSIIRTRNDKKIQRINSIAREAVEQSWGRYLPDIQFYSNLSEIIKGKQIFVFDKSDNDVSENPKFPPNAIGIIGPEGGLTKGDYANLGGNIHIISLGDTVLRTETASIVVGWLMK